MDREDQAWAITLERCPGIGPKRFLQLLEATDGELDGLFNRQTPDRLELSPAQVQYLRNPDWGYVEQALAWRDAAQDQNLVTLVDPDYPNLLRQIPDPPPVLYIKGRTDLLDVPQIAVVGSRNCSESGRKTASDFAAYLSSSGLAITSGLALGIDRSVHLAALKADGLTLAVVGTGIDRVYPAANRQLAHDIAQRGAIISEFPLGTAPNSSNFPRRNRVISGLGIATLVVEATRNSGSLITARSALEQGREVFAIPGSIHSPHSKGCHQLIREGAKLVDQASDIIDDIASLLGFIAEQATSPTVSTDTQPIDAEYQRLLEAMGYDPVSMDTLVARSGLTVEQLSSMLLLLELNDQIKSAPGGLFIRC